MVLIHRNVCPLNKHMYFGQIAAAESAEDFRNAVTASEELIDIAGCIPLSTSFDNRFALVNAVIRFLVIDRIQAPLDQ